MDTLYCRPPKFYVGYILQFQGLTRLGTRQNDVAKFLKARLDAAEKAFPIIWTALYVASAIAATRVALSDDPAPGLALWSVQIALNTLWTPVFFTARTGWPRA